MREAAGRVYAEMAAAGYGAVGEFHYVHHRPDGTPYDDPNAMAVAVAEAAVAAGLQIVLLPTAYHRAGFGLPADDRPAAVLRPGRRHVPHPRRRAARVGRRPRGRLRRRRRPQRARGPGRLAGGDRRLRGAHRLVRHVHAHEQPRELDECRAEHGVSPIELLHRTGFLGPRTSVIHAIHVEDRDLAMLADTGTIVVTCPTTEGSLGDGHFPALRHHDAGVRIAIGSDSNVRVDPFEETRELETLARRERRTRHALLAHHGDLWASSPRRAGEPRDRGRRDDRRRPRPPGPARRRRGRPPARRRDVRLGRRRGPARARLGFRADADPPSRRPAPGAAPAPGRRRARADPRRGRRPRPARGRGRGDPARRPSGHPDRDRDRAPAGHRRPRHAPLRPRRRSTGSRSSTRPG